MIGNETITCLIDKTTKLPEDDKLARLFLYQKYLWFIYIINNLIRKQQTIYSYCLNYSITINEGINPIPYNNSGVHIIHRYSRVFFSAFYTQLWGCILYTGECYTRNFTVTFLNEYTKNFQSQINPMTKIKETFLGNIKLQNPTGLRPIAMLIHFLYIILCVLIK